MTSPKVLSADQKPIPRPLRADAALNRKRLLIAGRAVFAQGGLNSTMDDIAAHAGLGVATAYRHFANKEEIIEALFELRIEDIVAFAQESLDAPDAWEALVQFLERACASMAADKGLREVLLRTSRLPSRVEHARTRLLPLTGQLITRAQASGHLRADLEPLDFPMLLLMIEAIADYTYQINPNLWRRYLTLLLEGLRTTNVPTQALPEHAPTLSELRSPLG